MNMANAIKMTIEGPVAPKILIPSFGVRREGFEPDVRIAQIGAGGTGGYVAANLLRLIGGMREKNHIQYTLIDGDEFEPKNLGRQLCLSRDIGENKAVNIVRKYSQAYGVPHATAIDRYLDGDMLNNVMPELLGLDMVPNIHLNSPEDVMEHGNVDYNYFFLGANPVIIFIDCVDKTTPRKLLYDFLKAPRYRDSGSLALSSAMPRNIAQTYIVSSGNGEHAGQVYWGRYVEGSNPFTYDNLQKPLREHDSDTLYEYLQKNFRFETVLNRTPGLLNRFSVKDYKELYLGMYSSVPIAYDRFPNMVDVAEDLREEQMSCAERAEANVQNIMTNQTAATLTLNYVSRILRGLFPASPADTKPMTTTGVNFNVNTNNLRSELFTEDNLKLTWNKDPKEQDISLEAV